MTMTADPVMQVYWGRNRDDRLPFTTGWREARTPAADPLTTGSLPETDPASRAAAPDKKTVKEASAADEDDGLDFDDLLDIINPLQHIPVVSTLYREVTGDEISTPARIAGGGLFGGVLGLLGSVIDSAVDDITGKDIGEHVMATLFGEDEDPLIDPATGNAVAEAETGAATEAAAEQVAAKAKQPAPVPEKETAELAAAPEPAPAIVATPAAAEETVKAAPAAASVPAVAQRAVPGTMPQMSADAFDLLLKHFGNEERDALLASLDEKPHGNTGDKTGQPALN